MIACIVTVYNEEGSIIPLLNALTSQTKMIDEIIIVDAFSTDSTFKLVKNFITQKRKKNIKVFRKRGNRSKGRNFGIKKAKSNIILITDAGCIPARNWAERLVKGFKKDIDIVSGFYVSGAKTPFTQSLSTYTCVMNDKLNPIDYLPSSRSISFRKEVWQRINGYPEHLDTCEDLVFARNLRRAGFHFKLEKKAYVVWPQKNDIFSAFKQLYGYAKGDGQAMYIRPQTPFLFGRYLIGTFLLLMALYHKSISLSLFLTVGFLGYLLWSILKNERYVDSKLKFIYLPMLQVSSDIAVLAGMTIGVLTRKKNIRKPNTLD